MLDHVYDHTGIEEKWMRFWDEKKLFQSTHTGLKTASNKSSDSTQKQYLLFAFAYPSGSGLHVGHVESKTALDILARYYRMNGQRVFFPVGWDAFGLPAENYAIKTGVHPSITTKNAIDTFRAQIKRLGISYDWENEVATSHPGYYKWTQWIFQQLYKKKLAYQANGMVNWCPSCQTVLANEQVVNGHCERCGTGVIQKEMKQWFFHITKYKEEMISGLEEVDWPKATKQQQLNWIGKKEGINITYKIDNSPETITCFTTRPDTNFGATFIVLAPEHEFAQRVAGGELKPSQDHKKVQEELQKYLEQATKKTELDRQTEARKKTGVFTGFYAINNLTGEKMPVWVSDFVLGGFGTGAVIGVPGHDMRDFQFAQTFQIPIKRVVVGSDGDTSEITREDQVQEESGKMVNSEFLDNLEVHEASNKMMDHLEQKGWGKRVITYKLRDWLISRQRYWGAPIPIVYDPEGKAHPVKEEHLPWLLPTDVEFNPTGESPLKHSKEFQERTERLYGKGWTPEYDTMDTFVDSSWYFLRYMDSRNEKAFVSKQMLKEWLPVDLYMIGPEHIVLHLLYARFFTKFLRDEGYLSDSQTGWKIDEPFKKMRHQGMILGPDGKKMSKSKGNVINPDEVIHKYGADTLRVYEMFMGPLDADKPWNTSSVIGMYRFLQRIWRLCSQAMLNTSKIVPDREVTRKLHQTIKKVSTDIPNLKFNTALASMMEFINVWEYALKQREKNNILDIDQLFSFIKILCPFTPFIAEELYSNFRQKLDPHSDLSVHLASWPSWDDQFIQDQQVKIIVQVNSKVRAELLVSPDQLDDKEELFVDAKKLDKLQAWIQGKLIQKEIYVPGKLINFVVE